MKRNFLNNIGRQVGWIAWLTTGVVLCVLAIVAKSSDVLGAKLVRLFDYLADWSSWESRE
jgi:hypothetical protein